MYMLDSDAIRKLAQYDLLTELCYAYKTTPSNFLVLPELKFQLKLGDSAKAIKILGSKEAYQKLMLFLDEAGEITEFSSEAANEILNLRLPNLDSGEQVILAAMIADERHRMLSGDKKAFIAIARITHSYISENFWPRVICLEEALHAIINSNDFDLVSKKIRSKPRVDAAIKIAFGSSVATSFDSAVAALESYISYLIKDTNNKYVFEHNVKIISS